MTILKPMCILLSRSFPRLYASYTTALLCLPGLPFFRLPHWYGTRHNADRAQGTVNASTRVRLPWSVSLVQSAQGCCGERGAGT